MEPWQFELEFEIDKLIEEKTKRLIKKVSHQNICPTCESELIGNKCPECGTKVGNITETYHDDGFEEYEKQIEREWAEIRWEDVPDEE